MEPSLGIIAGCIATLRPLFNAWGFGPSNSSVRYGSRSRGNTPSAPAWNQSRGMHKLEDGHISAIDTKRRRPKQSDSSSLDIELFGPTNPTTIDPDTSIKSWGVESEQEQGAAGGSLTRSPPVQLQTSIAISLRKKGVVDSDRELSSPNTVLPIQGGVQWPTRPGLVVCRRHWDAPRS